MDYYIFNGEESFGPMPAEDLLKHNLSPESKVWRGGLPAWVAAKELPELAELLKQTAVSQPLTPPPPSIEKPKQTNTYSQPAASTNPQPKEEAPAFYASSFTPDSSSYSQPQPINNIVPDEYDDGEYIDHNESISGWLFVFLWIGIFGGMILTIFTSGIIDVFDANYYSSTFKLVSVANIGIFWIIGIMTIISFYRRKPNAVAWGYTYIAVKFLDSLFLLILSSEMSLELEAAEIKSIIQGFAWCLIWGLFLKLSQKISTIFPDSCRKWGNGEKIALIVAIAVYAFSFYILTNPEKIINNSYYESVFDDYNNDYSEEYSSEYQSYKPTPDELIANAVENDNNTLPFTDNGITVQSVVLENRSIIVRSKYIEIDKDYLPYDYDPEIDAQNVKREILNTYNITNSEPNVYTDYLPYALYHGYKVIYIHNDMYDREIFRSVLTKSDYYNQLR